MAEQVLALRRRYDPVTASLPAEITIAGSSGVGVLLPDQNPEYVLNAVERIGCEHLPLITSFVAVSRFPRTQVFWLKPRERGPFDAIQSSLSAAGVKFSPNPFSFNPHCTLSAQAKLSQAQEAELLATTFPKEEFSLSTLSLYQLIEERASLLRSFSFYCRPNALFQPTP